MVRAATWLHFGSGGSPALRVSTTVTSTPRQATSMASTRPTGPAPTIRTLQPDISGNLVSSFRFRAGILHDHGPAIDLGLDVSGKTVRRRRRQRLQRNRRQLFP